MAKKARKEKKIKKLIQKDKKRRVKTPNDIEAQVLFLNDRTCCMCHDKSKRRIQIHHINENPADYDIKNLAVVCTDCHDSIKDKLWMGQKISEEEVKMYKKSWEKTVAQGRKTEKTPDIIPSKIIERFDKGGKLIERQTYKYPLDIPNLARVLGVGELGGERLVSRSDLEERLSKCEIALGFNDISLQKLIKNNITEKTVDLKKVVYSQYIPVLDMPQLVKKACRREQTTKELINTFKKNSWTALNGDCGCGKTQLAILITKEISNLKAWLGIRGVKDLREASMRFDAACNVWSGSNFSGSHKEWYENLCRKFGESSIIVIDDLPRLSGSDEFSMRLISLVEVCTKYGIKILTTSNFKLPKALIEQVGTNKVSNTPVPLFKEDEINDLFETHGAPSKVLKAGLSKIVKKLTRGHATLVAATARYLENRNWSWTIEEMDGLFKGEYAAGINDETIEKLLISVEDDETRELLYRIKLIIYTFTKEDVEVVGSINPIIRNALEKFSRVIGIWVQQNDSGNYILSPLIKMLKGKFLPDKIKKDVSFILGSKVLSKGSINQIEAQSATLYFLQAEAFNNAAIVLITTLSKMIHLEGKFDDVGMGFYWGTTSLPKEIDLPLRIILRALQIAVNEKLGRDVTLLVDELKELVEEVQAKDSWAVLGATIYLLSNWKFAQKNPTLILRFISKTIKQIPETKLPDGSKFVLPETLQIEKLIWLGIQTIIKPIHLLEWLEMIEGLPSEIVKREFEGIEAEEACMVISNLFWPSEGEKTKESQNWGEIISCFEEVAQKAHSMSLNLLWACAKRAKMIILAEYLDDLEKALSIGWGILQEEIKDDRINYLIKQCMGNQFFYNKRYDKALPLLENALDYNVSIYPIGRLRTITHVSKMVSENNPKKATELTQQGVNLAKKSEYIPEVDVVRALGELAIAKWLENEDVTNAFESFNEAGEKLLDCRKDSLRWKAVFMSYAHTSGYLSHLASSGEPPQETQSGERYVQPFRGMFYAPMEKERAALFDENGLCFLMVQLAELAEAIGDDNRATDWAMRGLEEAREKKRVQAIPPLCSQLIPQLLEESKYRKTVELALECGSILIALNEVRKQELSSLNMDLQVDEILGEKTNELWKLAEEFAGIMGLIPIIFKISTIALDNIELARAHAKETMNVCEEISKCSADARFWKMSAEMFKMLLSESVSGREIISKVDECRNFGYGTLHAIGYIGLCIKSDTSVEYAIQTQLSVMPWIHTLYKQNKTLWRKIVLPFLTTYWEKTFENQKFRFLAPRIFSGTLNKALKESSEKRAQAILKTIVDGLGVTIRKEVKDWFEEG